MKSAAVSGATGFAGRFIVEALLDAGLNVTALARTPPDANTFSRPVAWRPADLDPDVAARDLETVFAGVDLFVHCAFSHVPGRYRGGEGDDPQRFVRLNRDGSLALMQGARRAGVKRAIFLSSRAVYGDRPPGAPLYEDMPCRPDTLSGNVKHAVETGMAELASDRFVPISLRVTGIYGPVPTGQPHKWSDLFDDFAQGAAVEPRVATEVHGDDLGKAVVLVSSLADEKCAAFGPAPIFNVSDIVLDRRHLLGSFAHETGLDPMPALPPAADPSGLNVMDCTRLRALGWLPRGRLDLSGLVKRP